MAHASWLVFPVRSMDIFTQWSSQVTYCTRNAIQFYSGYYFLKVADIFVIPEFHDGLRFFVYCLLFTQIPSYIISCLSRPLWSRMASGENAKDLYLSCVWVRYAFCNLITLQTVLFVSSFQVSLPSSCLHCRLLVHFV